MTTGNKATHEINNMIRSCVIATVILVFISLYSYIILSGGIIWSLIILLPLLFFVKITYDAYNTPILYIRQYISTQDRFNEQVIELRKVHKISKRNWLWNHNK